MDWMMMMKRLWTYIERQPHDTSESRTLLASLKSIDRGSSGIRHIFMVERGLGNNGEALRFSVSVSKAFDRVLMTLLLSFLSVVFVTWFYRLESWLSKHRVLLVAVNSYWFDPIAVYLRLPQGSQPSATLVCYTLTTCYYTILLWVVSCQP